MVLPDEVNPVNESYRALSSRYKAGWTFHRFLLGLRKFFGSKDLDDRTGDFQDLYKSLKAVSLRLNDLDFPPVVAELQRLDSELSSLMESLDDQDRNISPSLVRLFLQRVQTQDERILIDLVRFYLDVQRGRTWDPPRVDKVDFLLTRVGEGASEAERGDRERLSRVLKGLTLFDGPASPTDPQKIANRVKLIEAVRDEFNELESFEELTQKDLVSHYRNLKHGLGALMFEKSVLPLVVNTNLLAASRVQELTESAQNNIFTDYEKVSELEEQGLLTQDLTTSVSELHSKVSKFRKQINKGTVRLDEVAGIRETVRKIFGRLELSETSDLAEQIGVGDPLAVESVLVTPVEQRVLGREYSELEAVLSESKRGRGESSAFHHRLLLYRFEPREIDAFTRLADSEKCNVRLEQFLLAAATLRRRIRNLVAEIREATEPGTASGAIRTRHSPEDVLQLADLYLRQFDHYLELDASVGGSREAGLKSLKMRMMREFAGLWLLVYGAH